ncbi:MAG: hypothetical protein QM747_12320 [Nocardioides sp.]
MRDVAADPTAIRAPFGRRPFLMGQAGFPEAFARALSTRGVSLSWLHQRLVERGHPVSPAALSYWRSGRSQPERETSREALVEIERLLHVPPGSLVGQLGPSRRPGPRPGERSTRELLADHPGVLTALGALGFEGLYDELTEHLRHVVVDVDRDGCVVAFQLRAAMQARHDGARRTPNFLTTDEGGPPRFIPVAGCRIGRTHLDPEARVFGSELVLDRPLTKDEIGLYEIRVELAQPSPDPSYHHFAARRMAELLVWVRFDPARLPTLVERRIETEDGEDVSRVELGSGTSAHALARGFGPGMLGLRWEW